MKKEVSPALLIAAIVVVLVVAVFAYLRTGPPAPKRTTEELAQHRPAPKIPPLGGPPPAQAP